MEYKYYILHGCSTCVYGVLSESADSVAYDLLGIRRLRNRFTNDMESVLKKYDPAPPLEMKKDLIVQGIDKDELRVTKDYWVAWEHASGKKRKAINTNDTTN